MFRFGFDKRTIMIILGVLLILTLMSLGTEGILNLLLMIPGVLIAITFHEFAHAYTAYKLGDNTPRLQGRLNLNPISHIDWMGLLFLIVAGFGWGRPVQIDSRNFNGKYSISKAEAIVSVAGPISNFILAFILIILSMILVATNAFASMSAYSASLIYSVILYAISINVSLGVFNLIPVPPLDGSKILMHFLKPNAKRKFYEKQHIFYIVFLVLIITDLSQVILTPIFNAVLTGLEFLATQLVGLFL